MLVGVQHILGVIADLQKISVDGVSFFKGNIFKKAGAFKKLVDDIEDLVAQIPQALPEFADLDPEEVGQVSKAAYQCVKGILESFKH